MHLHILKCIHYSGITRSCRNSPLNNKQPKTKTKLGQYSSTAALTKVAIFINFYCYLHTLLSTILDKLPHVQFCYESKWDRIATVSTDFQEFFLFVSNETRGFDNDLWSREKKNWNEKKCKIHVRWREVKDLHFSFLSSLFDFDIDIDVDIWHSKSTTEISILQVNC